MRVRTDGVAGSQLTGGGYFNRADPDAIRDPTSCAADRLNIRFLDEQEAKTPPGLRMSSTPLVANPPPGDRR
jgi:hypothetical protein